MFKKPRIMVAIVNYIAKKGKKGRNGKLLPFNFDRLRYCHPYCYT